MKRKIITLLLLSSILNAGLFYDEKNIGENSKKESKQKNNNNNNNKFDLSTNNFQEQINLMFKNSQFSKLIEFSEYIMTIEKLKPSDKQLLLNYIFDKYVDLNINKTKIEYTERQEIINFLYQISSKFNGEEQKSEFNMAIFKAIENKEMVVLKYFEDYNKKYYPKGINDKEYYVRMFSIFTSQLIENKQLHIARSLYDPFKNFLKSTSEYSEDLNILFLKYAISIGEMSEVKPIAEKVINNNKFSSDGYYYLAVYYDKNKNLKKYEENIINSIKYDVKNAKAYHHYLHYCVENKYKLEVVIKISSFYFDKNYDSFYNPLIQYEQGLAYFKLGADKNNYELILKSYHIFKELNKKENMKITQNILKNLDYKKYKKDF